VKNRTVFIVHEGINYRAYQNFGLRLFFFFIRRYTAVFFLMILSLSLQAIVGSTSWVEFSCRAGPCPIQLARRSSSWPTPGLVLATYRGSSRSPTAVYPRSSEGQSPPLLFRHYLFHYIFSTYIQTISTKDSILSLRCLSNLLYNIEDRHIQER
jgi:hypothetical protein